MSTGHQGKAQQQVGDRQLAQTEVTGIQDSLGKAESTTDIDLCFTQYTIIHVSHYDQIITWFSADRLINHLDCESSNQTVPTGN